MTKRVHWTHEKPNGKKPKLDAAGMDAVAEKAAALTSLAAEFCQNHPVDIAVVREKILLEWAHGCDRIDMELTAAVLEKTDDFQVSVHMSAFKALLEDSIFKAPVSSAQEAGMNGTGLAINLASIYLYLHVKNRQLWLALPQTACSNLAFIRPLFLTHSSR